VHQSFAQFKNTLKPTKTDITYESSKTKCNICKLYVENTQQIQCLGAKLQTSKA